VHLRCYVPSVLAVTASHELEPIVPFEPGTVAVTFDAEALAPASTANEKTSIISCLDKYFCTKSHECHNVNKSIKLVYDLITVKARIITNTTNAYSCSKERVTIDLEFSS